MTVTSGDYDPSFRDPFLYLMLKSDRGCIVGLSASFPEMPNKIGREYGKLPTIGPEKDPFAHYKFEPTGNEIVLRNTYDAEKWKSINHAKFSKKIYSNRDKMERAKGNKKAIEEKQRQN